MLLVGLEHPERVHTLTSVATATGDPDLPPPTATFPAQPDDLGERDVQVGHVLEQVRAYDGVSRHYHDSPPEH